MLICINHQKGGVGKSTISFNLAITLSKILLNKTIEVVDLDNQQSITLRNYVRKEAGLDPLLIKNFKDTDSLKAYIAKDNDDKIIICDTGAYDSPINRLAAITADLVITPFSNSSFEFDGFQTYVKIIKDLRSKTGADISPYVVFNNIDPRTKNLDDLRAAISKDGIFQVLTSMVCSRADFKNSILYGKSVIEYKPKSKAASEIEALTFEIMHLLDV